MNEERIEKTAQAELAEAAQAHRCPQDPRRRRPRAGPSALGLWPPAVQHQLDAGLQGRDAGHRCAGSGRPGACRIATTTSRPTPSPSRRRRNIRRNIERMLTLAGLPAAQAEAQAAATYGLEKQLAAASMSRIDRRDPRKLYNRLEARRDDQAGATLAGLPDVSRLWRSARDQRPCPRLPRRPQQGAGRDADQRRSRRICAGTWCTSVAGRLSKSFVDEH